MKITAYSRNKFLDTMAQWGLEQEYARPMYEYLVYGFHPGGFWTALFANDAMGMIQHSHPSNPIPELKKVVGWIDNHCPQSAWGSYKKVKDWISLPESVRRKELENAELIFTEQEEIIKTLKSERTIEPFLF